MKRKTGMSHSQQVDRRQESAMSSDSNSLESEWDTLRIIDCDAHWTEPPDLWTARVPASLKNRVPVMKTVDGRSAWYLDDEIWATVGGNVIGLGGTKHLGKWIIQPFSEIGAEAWDVDARLSLMDSMGIYAAILYPNGLGFSANHIFGIDDLEARAAVLETYNDYLVEVQNASQGRLFPQAMLPVWDIEFTLREMQRLTDAGIRGFTISDKPELIGLPELPDEYFRPMWELANQLPAVMNFHIGSGRGSKQQSEMNKAAVAAGFREKHENAWGYFGPQRTMVTFGCQTFMSNLKIIANLCMSDMFDRYPNLKIVSAESGIGWIPFLLEALEYQFDQTITDERERSMQKLRPTEYFRNHIYVMFWFESLAPSTYMDHIGVENILVETDVPHPGSLYPEPRIHFEKVLANVNSAARRRVLQDNAAELYKIPLPSTTTATI
jgi:predicted TIM-barrel fold metal-dependent hydrolase